MLLNRSLILACLLVSGILELLGAPSAFAVSEAEIQKAINNKIVTADLIKRAKEDLEKLAKFYDQIGAKVAAEHLRKWLRSDGSPITYTLNDSITKDARTHYQAKFSHDVAHFHAEKAIRHYIELELQNGRSNFPSSIPLSQVGFSANGLLKLQGPTFYLAGYSNDDPRALLKLSVGQRDLVLGFGDMMGPHEGMIRNLTIAKQTSNDGTMKFEYSFEVLYKWQDNYTFKNDSTRPSFFRTAYYLEEIAKVVKPFMTSIEISESVKGSFVAPPAKTNVPDTKKTRPPNTPTEEKEQRTDSRLIPLTPIDIPRPVEWDVYKG